MNIPNMPAKYERLLRDYIINGLAHGRWLAHVYLQEIRGKEPDGNLKVRLEKAIGGKIHLADSDWDEVLPIDAIKWVENYTPRLAGNLKQDVLEKVQQVLRTTLFKGLSVRDCVKALDESAPELHNMTKARLNTIARTELTRADTMGRLIEYKSSDDVEGVEFSAILDDRTTDICESRHGLRMRLDDSRLAQNSPPLHPNCRSLLLAVTIYDLKLGEELQTSPEFDDVPDGLQRITDVEAAGIALMQGEAKKQETWKESLKFDNIVSKAIGVGQGEPMSIEEALAGVNPNYYRSVEYQDNCQRCVQAYELRRRGFDVEALPFPSQGNTIYAGHECFSPKGKVWKNAFISDLTAAKVKQELANAPNGARYFIGIKWKGRGGSEHVFIAEKTSTGEVRYIDPQINENDVSWYFKEGKRRGFSFFRVDDQPLTNDRAIILATVKKSEPKGR